MRKHLPVGIAGGHFCRAAFGLIVTSAVLTWASSAAAAIIAVDDFNEYDVGPLAGENGGSGWAAGWSTPASPTPRGTVTTPTVPLDGPRAVAFTGASANNNPMRRQLAAGISDPFYFSYTFRLTSPLGGSEFAVLWLDNNGTDFVANGGLHTTSSIFLGMSTTAFFGRLSTNNSGDGSTTVNSTSVPQQDANHTLVGHVFKSGSTKFDRLRFWVNPTLEDVENGDNGFDVSRSISLDTISYLGFRTGQSTGTDDSFLVGSIRLGTTPADIVIVPEPATSLLLLVGMAAGPCWGIGLRRRRPIR